MLPGKIGPLELQAVGSAQTPNLKDWPFSVGNGKRRLLRHAKIESALSCSSEILCLQRPFEIPENGVQQKTAINWGGNLCVSIYL